MIVNVSLLNTDLVISAILAFIAGMAGVIVYNRIKNISRQPDYRVNDTIVEAVVLEYTRKLQDYDKVIAELRSKVDIMEARAQAHTPVSQQPSQPQPHVAPMTGSVIVTQHAPTEMEGNGTTDYILKLLSERPRTSREVQQSIGRTREHTARLMKKLHDLGLVSRDINTKPFRYNITDVGQETLRERAGAASIAV